jgi:allantoicase
VTDRPEWTSEPDLASRRFGGSVPWATDELFAAKENLIDPRPPVHRPGTFGPRGQVYDGWETRRRREPGDDVALVRLGLPGTVSGVVVDTSFFTGNHPPHVSVEACAVPGYPSVTELSEVDWDVLVPRAPVEGDRENLFTLRPGRRYTHVRLTLHPDGGVARLRLHGSPVADPALLDPQALDLAALENGARIVGCSDMFYSSPVNLLAPGLAAHQAEGWETARRRAGGNDWVVVRLAAAGVPRFIELDTSHLKGNAPGWESLAGVHAPEAPDAGFASGGTDWFEVLPRTRLQPDTRHRFALPDARELTHVRLDIYPDGGLSRLRLFGGLSDRGLAGLAARFNAAR